ncbi:MAG: hypothetical protein GYB65_20300 [Chloroflexi bacterium]|nr:hypothetical protein [Chloroflexota bacterium]
MAALRRFPLPAHTRLARTGLGTRGRALAALQALQVTSGLVGQAVLLLRWSPHTQTDLFLLLSGVPWLASAAVLVTGLEMALPAAYHRARATTGAAGVQRLVRQVQRLSLWASLLAALVSGVIVALWASGTGLAPDLSAWMGLALGAQVIPAALSGLWRGVLVAEDRLVRARITLLAGSLLTVTGYALLPGPAAFALPLTACAAVVVGMALAWRFFRQVSIGAATAATVNQPAKGADNPHLAPLLRSLLALSAAAGLVHIQAVVERAVVLSLETGAVTALTVASKGWDALLTVIVAACVLPVFPRWADFHAREEFDAMRHLLRWSLRRAVVLSLLAAGTVALGVIIYRALPVVWEAGDQAAEMARALLLRFLLVSSLQPLILKHYASGTPWIPVLGSALGVVVLALAAPVLVPRLELVGVALATTLSVLPGWLVLGWYEWGRGR